jgi:transposase-like protein
VPHLSVCVICHDLDVDKELLEECLGEGLSLEAIGKRVGKHESTISYWLKKHGLEAVKAEKHAAKGGVSKEEMERLLAAGLSLREIGGYYRCKRCRAERVSQRRRTIKRKLVAEAGGKCLICGYDRCQQVLQFHHLDPSTKTFHLAQRGASRSLAQARAEARKCVLLCANCHGEVEAGIATVPLNSVPLANPE